MRFYRINGILLVFFVNKASQRLILLTKAHFHVLIHRLCSVGAEKKSQRMFKSECIRAPGSVPGTVSREGVPGGECPRDCIPGGCPGRSPGTPPGSTRVPRCWCCN